MKNLKKIIIISTLFLLYIFWGYNYKIPSQAQGGACGSTYVTDVDSVSCNFSYQTGTYTCGSNGDGSTLVRNCYNQGGGCNAAYRSDAWCNGLPYGCTLDASSGLAPCTSSSPTNTPAPTSAPPPPTNTPTPVCTSSNPDTPVLSAPASGTTVNVNASVNLDWDPISSWGTGCPSNTNTYEVCVQSTGTCDKVNATGISSSTTNQSWTPTTGGYTASWNVRSNNGSKTATSATRTLCIENELCPNPQCGEPKFCGGNCLDTDNGAPNVPVFSNANNRTVTSMPVSFTWTTGGVKTDYYNKSLDAATGVSVGNFLTVSNISVATTGWHNLRVQSVNDTCGTDVSSWSDPWSAFCYETQNCSPKCGQDLACSATNCSNDDNGAPGAPTIISPKGTSDIPALIPGNAPQAVPLNWTTVAKADRYVVGLYNSGGILIWNPSAMTIGSTTTQSLVAGLYYWRVRGINDTCSVGQTSPASTTEYFRINSPPVINSITITNNVGTTLAVETGNQNHICQSIIQNSSDQRKVRFLVNASDPNGGSEINLINLTWHGRTYATTLGTVNGNNRVGVVDVPFSAVDNDGGVWGVGATVVDIYGFNGQLTPRSFKVWNCQVPIVGTLYNDLNQSAICSSDWSSMLSKLSADAGFNALKFTNTASPYPSVVMSPNAPADYSSASGSGLIWGKSYISVFNNGSYPTPDNPLGNLLASGINTKIADLGRSPNVIFCPTGQTFNIGDRVDPYSTDPNARVVFKFVEDQEAWYQVVGAGVKGKEEVESGVPVTALQKALTWSGVDNVNGLVSSNNLMNNITGCSESTCLWGNLPNNWYLEQSTNDLDIYNYNYFYNNFFVKAGVGVTGTNWAEKPVNGGIYLVKNSLTIDGDFILANPNTETMMVIVNGDININQGVKNLDGIYIANGSISAGGDSATALTINGMLYARGSVILNRSFTDKTFNNANPAVKVNYSPGLIFNLDPKVLQVLSGWREE